MNFSTHIHELADGARGRVVDLRREELPYESIGLVYHASSAIALFTSGLAPLHEVLAEGASLNSSAINVPHNTHVQSVAHRRFEKTQQVQIGGHELFVEAPQQPGVCLDGGGKALFAVQS